MNKNLLIKIALVVILLGIIVIVVAVVLRRSVDEPNQPAVEAPPPVPAQAAVETAETPALENAAPEKDPRIRIINPNGGESWPIGSEQTITWKTADAPTEAKVAIKLSSVAGNLVSNIAADAASYTFTIPEVACGERYDVCLPLKPSSAAIIKIELYVGSSYCTHSCPPKTAAPEILASDTTDGTFTISKKIGAIITVPDPAPPPTSIPVPTPPPPPSTKFTIGDKVQTSGLLNARENPRITGLLLGAQTRGTAGIVISGPTYANNYWWWKIDYDINPDGWSVENSLIDYVEPVITPPAVIPVPNPTPPAPPPSGGQGGTGGADLPNLYVSDITISPDPMVWGRGVRITATLINNGGGTAAGVHNYLENLTTAIQMGVHSGYTITPGQQLSLWEDTNVSLFATCASGGWNTLRFNSDSANNIAESNESDNFFDLTTLVAGCP